MPVISMLTGIPATPGLALPRKTGRFGTQSDYLMGRPGLLTDLVMHGYTPKWPHLSS